MNYWLLKSDSDTYSWADMQRDKTTNWDGVRNFQARNNLIAMKNGDLCFFYHSGEDKAVVGIVEVCRENYKFEENFVQIDVKIKSALKKAVTLAQIKQNKKLVDVALIKQSRLSVMPVSKEKWHEILKLSDN